MVHGSNMVRLQLQSQMTTPIISDLCLGLFDLKFEGSLCRAQQLDNTLLNRPNFGILCCHFLPQSGEQERPQRSKQQRAVRIAPWFLGRRAAHVLAAWARPSEMATSRMENKRPEMAVFSGTRDTIAESC